MDWIGSILESIREMECPCCGARLASCSVRGVTSEPSALVVRLACAICGENSIAVVKREGAADADADANAAPPITRDDVLDAHEFLVRWHGPVAEIINAA